MSHDLFEAARAAMAKAHAPYSRFPVGAALRTEDGRVYSGCNIENASFPEGWCAETTALGHYVMGGGGRITEIAVVAEKMDRITPCGGCRQRLAEFAGPDARLHLCDGNGVVQTLTMADILPLGFRGDDLK
ncbi:MAG: cytidine deaminase [Rhizobiaceae bacterium]